MVPVKPPEEQNPAQLRRIEILSFPRLPALLLSEGDTHTLQRTSKTAAKCMKPRLFFLQPPVCTQTKKSQAKHRHSLAQGKHMVPAEQCPESFPVGSRSSCDPKSWCQDPDFLHCTCNAGLLPEALPLEEFGRG